MTTPAASQDLSFLQKCTAVSVRYGSLSFHKKLPKSAVRVESDPDRISASKRLLDCKEADAIRSAFGALRQFIVARTLPSPFGNGVYFVPNTRLAEVDEALNEAQSKTIPEAGEALISVYQDVMRREQEALGANFNSGDYDSPAEIRARLGVEYSYVVFGVPENLPNAMYAREQAKAQTKLTEAVDTMQQLLRAEMAKLISHAVDRLKGTNADGKPLVFRNTLTDNIKEFLQLFRDRNITNDTELEALCDKAKRLLDGVDPQDLRDKQPLRESTARGFEEIKTQLDSMMTPRGGRSILFEDEDVAA